jgi:hypothetical protein
MLPRRIAGADATEPSSRRGAGSMPSNSRPRRQSRKPPGRTPPLSCTSSRTARSVSLTASPSASQVPSTARATAASAKRAFSPRESPSAAR